MIAAGLLDVYVYKTSEKSNFTQRPFAIAFDIALYLSNF